jgi:hypothetical protein
MCRKWNATDEELFGHFNNSSLLKCGANLSKSVIACTSACAAGITSGEKPSSSPLSQASFDIKNPKGLMLSGLKIQL